MDYTSHAPLLFLYRVLLFTKYGYMYPKLSNKTFESRARARRRRASASGLATTEYSVVLNTLRLANLDAECSFVTMYV